MSEKTFSITGKVYNPFTSEVDFLEVCVVNGVITKKIKKPWDDSAPIITTGFICSHVHVESSLLPPHEFSKLAVRRGVMGVVADPHEIANVLGVAGIDYMIESGKKVPFYFFWGAPPCVPATIFETNGYTLGVDDCRALLDRPEITHLSEVMNYPGVLNGDAELFEKVSYAKEKGKPIDGHAPGLRGESAEKYVKLLGCPADHECFTPEEALDKIRAGGLVAIREGSAAKNFDALWHLLKDYPDKIMFCADDAHPDGIFNGWGEIDDSSGYIDVLVRRAIANGIEPMIALQAASRNPILHYNLPVGRLEVGDPADLITIESFESLKVLETYVKGELVQSGGESLISSVSTIPINNFNCQKIDMDKLRIYGDCTKSLRVIRVIPKELVTEVDLVRPAMANDEIVSSVENDVLKVVVVNRYTSDVKISLAFVTGFGLTSGAIASSVAHDSHNIVAVGTNDEDLLSAVNAVIDSKGGLVVSERDYIRILPLPIAGLMSDLDAFEVVKRYEELDQLAKVSLGSSLPSPFMSLSFIALLVIPALKISDMGLFDGSQFCFVPLQT